MPTIDPFHKDTPGHRGLFFRIKIEPGQRALARFELLEDRVEVAHRHIDCGEGERDYAIEKIFPERDLGRSGLEVTYTIGPGGLEKL